MYQISVIIPVYNAEKDLKKAINSLINQTLGFENIEVIIVDDKSTDNTKQIIEDYSAKYTNIKGVFLDKNSGLPGKPRSLGIQYATADYIVFLDADDEYLPNGLEILYNSIQNNNNDFVMSNHYLILDNNKNIGKLPVFGEKLNFNPMDSKELFDNLSWNTNVAPWAKIFNKEFVLKNNITFPTDSLCEDAYFYFKCLINATNISVIKDITYNYYTFHNKETAIHGHDKKTFYNFLKGINYINTLLKDIKYPATVSLSDNISSLLLIFSNLNKKDKKEVIDEIYTLEKEINCEIKIARKEVEILNNLIMSKQFKKAIWISEVYKSLYNNKSIKNLYRKVNSKKVR